jgi:hypothetical protein
MWTSGFFNSVNGDRLYNADQMSRIFEGLITDGVCASVGNKLAVQPNSGMTIQIATGRGWFGRHWVNNDSEYTLTVAESDVVLKRYVAVCIKVDDTDAVRDAVPYLKYGEFATNPVKPTMTRTETVKEYCLAYIYIGAGVSEIKASDIEDTRANESLCGWVTGLIEQLSSATLFEQFTAIFNDWFNGLVDMLNEDVEAMLVNALPTSVTVTLTAGNWVAENGLYKQNVTVTNMNATKSVMVSPNSETATAYSASEIRCTAQSANTLEFTAITLPTGNVNVDVMHMGV